MEAIDHSNTMVLLIGVSNFPNDPSIDTIPDILANVQSLKESLTDHELAGIHSMKYYHFDKRK